MRKSAELLNQAIGKWEDLLEVARKEKGKQISYPAYNTRFYFGNSAFHIGIDVCPLCDAYFADYCVKCPVMKRTGKEGCIKTPYREIENTLLNKKLKTVSPELIKLIKEELEFLKSLKD